MKRTFSELIEAISVHEESGSQNGRVVSATCPICGHVLTVPVLGNFEEAVTALQNNVVTHIRYTHPES
jgi:benzoyl-CoA reductase/2-hydroxyglutaryl-CoA dehydratase subunit BcrC/BadD/HgdB